METMQIEETSPTNAQRRTDKRFASAQGEEKSSWQVTDMWELHHAIVRQVFLGRKNTEIAKSLGCTPQQVSNVRNSKVVQDQLKQMQKQANTEVVSIKTQIGSLAEEAVKVLKEVMMSESTPPATRVNAAKDLLDRGGHAAVQQVNVAHGHFTLADLEAIKERARQIGFQGGPVVEDEADENDVIDI